MYKFIFENQSNSTYLVYQISGNDQLDTMSLGMLTNNDIPGFATARFTQMDTTKYIKYNVSAKVSVSQLFSGPVNKKRLIGVFSGIVDAMLSAEDYMIDTNSLLLDLDYIFADVSTCETVMICLPIVSSNATQPDLGMFFKNIIFNTQFDQTENCDHVAQILNYLNSTPQVSLPDFKKLLEDLGRKTGASAPIQNAVQPKAAPVSAERQAVTGTPPVQTVSPATAVPPVGKQPNPVPQYSNPQFGGNCKVPEQAATPQKQNDLPKVPQQEGEKPISMFYLLQHYNKDNAAKYKAQQAAKKEQKAPRAAKTSKTKAKQAPKAVNPGFAVPGQQAAESGFAIPGQQPRTVQQAAQTTVKVEQQKPATQQVQAAPAYQQPATPKSAPINFGETTVLGGKTGETTVLGAAANSNRVDPHLIRVKNNEKIPLNKPVFRIGKERSYVDYFVNDNTAVSRSHANIVNRDGAFYVVDTNSTNHTYVNGGMIQSNVETKLSHGTKIRLANEDFEFRMY